MALYSFEGPQGTGKSQAAIALCIEEYEKNGRKIISNNHINDIPYQHFNLEWFVENIATNELEDCVLFLDEAYQYMDSRMSQSKVNRLFTYFIVQTRKRGVDMYICTHHIDNVDLRLRRAIDIRGACSYLSEKPCKRCKCKSCGGTGKIEGKLCLECNGVGGTGRYNGDIAPCVACHGKGCELCGKTGKIVGVCERCWGYGETGVGRVHFLRVRGRGNSRRFTMDVFGPKYWSYYSTKERMPMQQKLMATIDTSEVI